MVVRIFLLKGFHAFIAVSGIRVLQINASACLSGAEIADLSENINIWVKSPSREASDGRTASQRLIHPPQLSSNGNAMLSGDEQGIAAMEAFYAKVGSGGGII